MRIVTDFSFTPDEVQQIVAAARGVELIHCKSRGELLEKAAEADVIYGSMDAEILERAKKLRWGQAGAAGDDPFGRGFEYVPYAKADVYGPIK